MAQIQIMNGVERRRRWSDEQKREIVAAAFAPGAMVADVARRADLNTGLIYRWRKQLGLCPSGFSEVVVSPNPAAGCSLAIEVVIGNTAQARIFAGTPPELAIAVIRAMVRR
jgi:transposase